MSDKNETAPSSPASAGALRGPSEAAAELEVRAAQARDEEQAGVDARKREEDAKRSVAARQREEEVRDARRAPTGFVRSMRFFTLMMGAGLLFVAATTNLLEGPILPWSVIGAMTGAWALVVAAFALDARTWRGRLPFVLDGFDRIDGDDDSGAGRAPWVRFTIEIVLRAEDRDARTARKRTLEILAARVNAKLQADKDASPTEEQRWRVDDDARCKGESTFSIYTTRVIEKWLRSDVALLATSHPVERVTFKARYTGESTLIPD